MRSSPRSGHPFLSGVPLLQPLGRLIGIAASAFYAWLRRGPTRRAQDEAVLVADTHAVGGHYCRLGDPDAMILQPLADIDQRGERSFAEAWLANVLNQEGVSLTLTLRDSLWSGLSKISCLGHGLNIVTGRS